MTTQQLIEKLKTLPPDLEVVTEGYEDGFDTIKKVSVLQVMENPVKKWFVGKYVDTESTSAQKVVLLYADTRAENK